MDWRPWKTVPRDGHAVLAWWGGQPSGVVRAEAVHVQPDGHWYFSQDGDWTDVLPSHWCEINAPEAAQ